MPENKNVNVEHDIGYLKARVEGLNTRMNWIFGIISGLIAFTIKDQLFN